MQDLYHQQYPKGPSTQIVGFQGPKTFQGMDFGTQNPTIGPSVVGFRVWGADALTLFRSSPACAKRSTGAQRIVISVESCLEVHG